ncbi:hypothetical protein ALC62_08776 [Cyphomyrmex costatus]|uniref:Uncharacterized protein n=1 Tax=Cyphomyrmex costatus TaxID=456900 RepID=A0A195CJ61_9HYME|nr:hypothetical protein ALC62_08776 [Cyphomyrmex costatus]
MGRWRFDREEEREKRKKEEDHSLGRESGVVFSDLARRLSSSGCSRCTKFREAPADVSRWNSMTEIESSNVTTTNGAIADNAAADRDRRFLIASTREEYARRRSGIADTSQPVSSARSDLIARRRRRDALAAIARPRRNTWHAENKDDAVRMTVRDPSGSPRIDVIGDRAKRSCALDATDSTDGFRNVRTADDERRTCCVSVDATTFLSRRGPARVIRDLIVERRNRRADSALLARSRSVAGGEEIFRSTVDSITIGRKDWFFEASFFGTTDFPKCNERILSTSSIVPHEVTGGSSVREIDSDVNTENLRTSDSARLIEIDTVESSYDEQPCVPAEEIVRRRDASSTVRFPAKLDPGGRAWRTKTDTRWKLPRIGPVQRTFLLGLLATSLLCDMVLSAPSSSSVLEDDVEEKELGMPRNSLGDDELEIIRRSIIQGLGLQRIPDPSKVCFTNTTLARIQSIVYYSILNK